MTTVTTTNPYEVGQVITLAVVVTVAGVSTDPTTIVLSVKTPDSVVATPTLTRDSTGHYHYDLLIAQSGTYWYRFVTTGVGAGAGEAAFAVRTLETV